MMKFFRKYNKHLLAVFMALLLMIWLAGDAIRSMLQPSAANAVVARTKYGPITAADVNRYEHESEMQELLGFSWRQQLVDRSVPSEEQLQITDWIMLNREADHYGVKVQPQQAKALLTAQSRSEAEIRQRAAARDWPVDEVYKAAAKYIAVNKMFSLVDGALRVPEAPLRVLAHDLIEKASIELVTLPAKSFADPEATFPPEKMQEQFEANKNRVGSPDSLEFGYYREPRVQVEYIKVDPHVIKDHLQVNAETIERDAYLYWQKAGKTDPALFRPMEERAMLMARAQQASSNGEAPPEVKEYYDKFADAKDRAIEAVKDRKAREEADIIVKTIAQRLQEPWFDAHVKEDGYKVAPAAALAADYLAKAAEDLPATVKSEGAVNYKKLEATTANELAMEPGLGAAFIATADGRPVNVPDIAFRVEGLGTIPKEGRVDMSLFLAKFQPTPKWVTGPDDSLYLFRVIDVQPGHVPASLDEVRDEVVRDLRIVQGMEKAREAAQKFAETVGTGGLADAWKGAEELNAKVTPEKGGVVQVMPFVRGTQLFGGDGAARVNPLGKVTDEFMTKAFEAAREPKATPAVVDLPNQAAVAVIKGQQLFPVYEEDFQAQRGMIQESVQRSATRQAMLRWINPKAIRERCEYQTESGKKPVYHGPVDDGGGADHPI